MPFFGTPAGILPYGTAGKFGRHPETVRLYGVVFAGQGQERGRWLGEGRGDC